MHYTHKMDDVRNFAHLSNFRSKRDFDNNTEMFLADHKDDFTKSELIAFKRLTRYSCKVPGISTVSIRKILLSIAEKDCPAGISESTFHRMRRKAIKFGILSAYTSGRDNGSQSSNVWVFNRYQSQVVSISTTNDTRLEVVKADKPAQDKDIIVSELKPRINQQSIKTSNIKSNTNTYSKPASNRTDFVNLVNLEKVEDSAQNPYQRFRKFVQVFTDNNKLVYDLYGVYLGQTKSMHKDFDKFELIDIAIDAVKATFIATKRKSIDNLAGFFNGVLANKLADFVNGGKPAEVAAKKPPVRPYTDSSEIARTGVIVENGTLVYPDTKAPSKPHNDGGFSLLNDLIAGVAK